LQLFGFEFKRKVQVDPAPSFAPKEQDDGAVIIAASGAYGTYIDLDGTVRTEAELVTKYREMALQPEVDAAVDEIVNETMSADEEKIVSIVLDNLKVSDKIKKAIIEEFGVVLNVLNFQSHAYDIYRRWYVDGRLYYHVIIDEKHPRDGIKEVRYVDPRKIRKIREISKKKVVGGTDSSAIVPKIVNEYFLYNDRGFNYGNKIVGPATTGLKIAKDSIVHVSSGLTDTQGTMVLSYLHKAIKAVNQLRTLEDAVVVYRLSRAPERRVWYIDVGSLPKMKAEQYVRDIMVKHKNRLIYDGATGEVRDDRKFMTMMEDYWLPRREGGKGTEVTTLPGGQTLGEMDDVLYFQKKLYQTLNVPVNRLNSDALFSLGRATEVTRDELKFNRFVSRLRTKFSTLFTSLLEKQIVLKGVMSLEDWQNICADIRYDYSKDNYFTELKDAEILENRINLMSNLMQSQMIGVYYSHEWARKNVLHQDDEQIEAMDEQIEEENNDPRWQPQEDDGMNPGEESDDQGAPEQGGAPPQEEDEKSKNLAAASALYHTLKLKKNRTTQEESQFKSVALILAKNDPQLLKDK